MVFWGKNLFAFSGKVTIQENICDDHTETHTTPKNVTSFFCLFGTIRLFSWGNDCCSFLQHHKISPCISKSCSTQKNKNDKRDDERRILSRLCPLLLPIKNKYRTTVEQEEKGFPGKRTMTHPFPASKTKCDSGFPQNKKNNLNFQSTFICPLFGTFRHARTAA